MNSAIPTTQATEPSSEVAKYFRSLDNLDTKTGVICSGAPADAPPEQCPIHKVKTYFEKGTEVSGKSPIVRPPLPLRAIPQLAASLNLEGDRPTLLRLVHEYPHFTGRTVLAEKGTCYTIEKLDFSAWVSLGDGEAIMVQLDPATENEKPSTMALFPGSLAFPVSGNKLMLYFSKDTILTMGNIAPKDAH